MLKKLIYRIELVLEIISAIYEKFRDWFKLAFTMSVWVLAYELMLKQQFKLDDWVLFASMAVIALIFAIYKVKKSYKKLLIMCAVPFYGIFSLLFINREDNWLICLVVMTYMFMFFSVFRKYDKDDLALTINNRVVFSIYLTSVAVLLISTVFLSILSLPFSFMAYYKHKWTLKSYKQSRTKLNKVLRIVLLLPVAIGCMMLMFMSAL